MVGWIVSVQMVLMTTMMMCSVKRLIPFVW